MKIRNSEALFQHLEHTTNSVIAVHRFPDVDALGSALAFQEWLQTKGINTVIWCSEAPDATVSFLPGISTIKQDLPNKIESLFVLDCSDLSRVPGIERLDVYSGIKTINIDHHADNTRFADINITEKISSVGELLATLFLNNNEAITEKMATNLYAAISYDTGGFSFSNVTAETLNIAAQLVEKGADPAWVSQQMNEQKTNADFQVMQTALTNLKSENGIVFTTLPKSLPESTVKVIDIIRQHRDAEVCLVFKELEGNQIKISLRSRASFNVSVFSKPFGGGGHPKASGILFNGTLAKSVETIISALKKVI